MTRTRPGRLYRTLTRLGVPAPLIEIAGDTFTVTDDSITSISVSHGGTDPSPAIVPSTCETVIQRPYWLKSGESLSVRMTDQAAAALALRTGVPASRFTARFTGRVGAQDNEDTPRGLSARMKAASWSAQLARVNKTVWLGAGTTVDTAIRHLVSSPALPEQQFYRYGEFDELVETMPEASSREDIAAFTSDIGVLVRNTREGRIEAWSLPYRESYARGRINLDYPLTRAQVLSPTTWSQPNETLPAKVSAEWISASGQVVARSAGGTEDSIIERHDWKYLRAQTGALQMRFDALRAQNWARLYRLPSITIDLLALLNSGSHYNRAQAGMLLGLNPGDTVPLSGDWHRDIRGLHVVSGIDETLNKDSWEIRLSLTPFTTVFGRDTPIVPAMTWDAADNTWDSESRNWNMEEL